MMKRKRLPPQDVLRQLLRYEPETGKLFWRMRSLAWFNSLRAQCVWNARYAEKEALTVADQLGYRRGSIFNVAVLAHRVIWAMQTDESPDEIDHIDGNPGNNAWDNLRAANRRSNMRNQKFRKTNTSGAIGVNWSKTNKKWQARIRSDGGYVNLGYYERFDDAVSVRKSAEVKYEYHANHGRDGTLNDGR